MNIHEYIHAWKFDLTPPTKEPHHFNEVLTIAHTAINCVFVGLVQWDDRAKIYVFHLLAVGFQQDAFTEICDSIIMNEMDYIDILTILKDNFGIKHTRGIHCKKYVFLVPEQSADIYAQHNLWT